MAEGQDKIFDAYYYQTGCGRPYQRDEEWLRFFNEIAERLIRETAPKTVLDAGCALGFLVEALRSQGVEAYGVDISEYAISSAHSSIQPYLWVGSIAEPFPQKYDLIVTIEVLEHMPKEEAEKAVANLCRHTDDIIFSSGNEDLRETTHINLHPAEYWAGLFAQQGFFRDVDFDGTFLTPWTVRFRRMNEPVHRVIMGYERQIDRLIQENAAVRQVNLELRKALSVKEQEHQELSRLFSERSDQVVALDAQLSAIVHSRTYRAANSFRSLVPAGSRRERWGLKLWRMISGNRR